MAKKKRSSRNRSKQRMPDTTESDITESAATVSEDIQSSQPQAMSPEHGQSGTLVLSRNVKLGLSLVIIVHLLAVVLPPLAFQTNGQLGQSSAVATAMRPLAAYAQSLYLDRGYAFFAPDPGPSHLFQAAITQPNGEIVETLFPDKEQQWPRLNYHRHFMLSEFLNEVYCPPGPPADFVRSDPEAAKEWVRLRRRYEDVRQSVVDHLRSVNNGAPVAIRRIEHVIPNHVEFQELDVDLSDPRLYMVMSDTALDRPPETVPAPPATEELKAPEEKKPAQENMAQENMAQENMAPAAPEENSPESGEPSKDDAEDDAPQEASSS